MLLLVLRCAPHPLLKKEATLLVVVNENTADESLKEENRRQFRFRVGGEGRKETYFVVDLAVGVEEETIVDLLISAVGPTWND